MSFVVLWESSGALRGLLGGPLRVVWLLGRFGGRFAETSGEIWDAFWADHGSISKLFGELKSTSKCDIFYF